MSMVGVEEAQLGPASLENGILRIGMGQPWKKDK